MKTLTTLAALILSIASLTVSANDVKKTSRTKAAIELPAMNWGAPEEVSFAKTISLPEMNWGSPEDIAAYMGKAAIQLPAMNWGTPEEVSFAKAISLPEMNWGKPEEVKEPVSMKIQLPAMNWACLPRHDRQGSADEISGL